MNKCRAYSVLKENGSDWPFRIISDKSFNAFVILYNKLWQPSHSFCRRTAVVHSAIFCGSLWNDIIFFTCSKFSLQLKWSIMNFLFAYKPTYHLTVIISGALLSTASWMLWPRSQHSTSRCSMCHNGIVGLHHSWIRGFFRGDTFNMVNDCIRNYKLDLL